MVKNVNVLSLMKHELTPDQIADGGFTSIILKDVINAFQDFPDMESVLESAGRASQLAFMVENLWEYDNTISRFKHVNIAGAGWFMVPLARELRERGFIPVQSFSARVADEVSQPDGSVKLTYTFVHQGWVEVLE